MKEFHRDHKRTQQVVPDELLSYLYYRYMVCASDKYSYSNVHVVMNLFLRVGNKNNSCIRET